MLYFEFRSYDQFVSHKNNHMIKIRNNAFLGFDLMIKVSTSWSILLDNFDLLINIIGQFRPHEQTQFWPHDWKFDLLKKLNFDLMKFDLLTLSQCSFPYSCKIEVPKNNIKMILQMPFVGSPVLRSWTFRGMEISSRSQTFQNSWSIFTIWLGRLKVWLFIRCNIIKEWPLASEFSKFEYSPEIHHFWRIWVLAKMAFSGNVSDSPDSPTFAKPCCTDSPDLPADPFSESDFHFSFLLFFFCSRLFNSEIF